MNLTMRLVCFFTILVLQNITQHMPVKIGQKKKTPFLNQVQLTFLITGAALGGTALFWGFDQIFGTIGGNEVVMRPFLVGLMSFVISGVTLLLVKKRLEPALQSCLLLLPILLNLALVPGLLRDSKAEFWYTYLLSLLFLFVVSLFSAGILERLKIAPIPRLLQGLPIQLTVLMLIFLSLSFFKGVFFDELF
ncbi:hypothetical protein ACWOE3_05940 [Enterococcus dispar]|uniref:Uncharacterized protein n=2 Tax=Enterococcus TaxID=1350 RepID=S1P1H0_9ENTE|nr:hypothetical protein [Enterococcus dispar]EOT38858.1 hypothetical protein OMK_02340 [Enterococcus dispar ATCC 51266]EOW86241.1 hypothetical protein I569_01564 [Enterococcus dispar ATCC 51266]OJG39239.1 hypothetical protein RV01_GL001761 [Enterococcus dispar]WCG32271.1 hypothetical protein PML78_08685 [Enterococcus dispar]